MFGQWEVLLEQKTTEFCWPVKFETLLGCINVPANSYTVMYIWISEKRLKNIFNSTILNVFYSLGIKNNYLFLNIVSQNQQKYEKSPSLNSSYAL